MKTKSDGDELAVAAYHGPDRNAVRQMFGEIAHRYDFLNHFLSVSVDRRWRRLAAKKIEELVRGIRPSLCLDLCSGTGDLAIELHQRLKVPVIASDFCHPMLMRSLSKTRGLQLDGPIRTVEADSLEIPFRTGAFDAVTIAFGLRNLEDPTKGLQEMRRVLRPDGALLILEFSRPVVPIVRPAFEFYFHHILPRLGAWISGQKTAYAYLPDSVGRFPSQNELAAMMEKAGMRNVAYRNLSGGIAALHWALK
jgi:demethylmenaquinone methyltransferase / 2-methoxy-6-polyprenyl-1,4-benzoquinol methylase